MKKSKAPAAPATTKLFGTREIAALAGRTDPKGVKSVGMILARHNIGQIIGGGRVIQGHDVARALELIKIARRGNPVWIEAGSKKQVYVAKSHVKLVAAARR